MAASSVQGTGPGSAEGKTTQNLTNRPVIVAAGIVETFDAPISPSAALGTVTFSEPLFGSPDNYVVILTGINIENAYVANRITSGNNFTSFDVISSTEGSVQYLVTTVGFRSL